MAIDPRVDIGHVHLKVANIDRSLAFWHDVLGFEVMMRIGDQAAFISAGGYHHHIGLNTWESQGRRAAAAAARPGSTTSRSATPTARRSRTPLRRVLDAGIPLEGASDHGVSEAIYLRDPDGNGVELYRDRPRDEWPKDEAGNPTMWTKPLDLDELLANASGARSVAEESPGDGRRGDLHHATTKGGRNASQDTTEAAATTKPVAKRTVTRRTKKMEATEPIVLTWEHVAERAYYIHLDRGRRPDRELASRRARARSRVAAEESSGGRESDPAPARARR